MDSSTGCQQSSSTANSISSVRSKNDPAWAHFKEDVGADGKKSWTCLHCNNVWRGGGINRMKKHLAGRKGDIAPCKKVPYDVRYKMEQSLKAFEEKNIAPTSFEDDNINSPRATDQEEETHPPHTQTKKKDNYFLGAASQKGKRKRDEMTNYFAPRTTAGAQRSIKSVLVSKEALLNVDMAIVRFFYDRDKTIQRKCIDEVSIYQDRLGSFARQLALDSSKSMQPDEWWRVFGCSAPNIQNLAIKILSQTSSSSGCERNWSVFERIHTKKRNRLEHQRLNDLVFVHYNLRLKERLDDQKNCQDPIDYESIDKTDFWVMEEEEHSSPILDIDELDGMLYGEEAIPKNAQEEDLDKVIGEMQETPSLELDELFDGVEDDNDYERTLQELDATWAAREAT